MSDVKSRAEKLVGDLGLTPGQPKSAGPGKQQPTTGTARHPKAPKKPVSRPGKGKTKSKSKKSSKDAQRAPAALPRGPYADQIDGETQIRYGDAERALREQIGQGQAHRATIDQAFDAYQGGVQDALQLHRETVKAGREAMQASAGQAAQQTAAAQGAARQGMDATAAAAGGQNQYADELAKTGAASMQAAGETAAIQQNELTAAGAANEASLSRLDKIIGTGLRQQIQGQNQAAIRGDQEDLRQIQLDKGAFKLQRQGELEQQDVENELATQTLLSEEQQAKMKGRLEEMGIRAQLEGYQTQEDIARLNNQTQAQIAEGRNSTQLTVAQINAAAAKARADANNRTTLEAARIRAKGSGKGKGTGKAVYADWTQPGRKVELTAAQESDWRQKKSKVLAVAEYADKERKRGRGDEGKVFDQLRAKFPGIPADVLRAAAQISEPGKGGLDDQGIRIMRSYFPQALVPGFKPGTWKSPR